MNSSAPTARAAVGDLGVGGLGPAVGDVVPDGPGEQVGLLGDEPEVAPVGRQRQVAEVGAVGRHPPGRGVVEAGQQLHHRGLPGARPADEGHRLPRPDGQVDPVEGPAVAGAVAEPDVFEAERPGQLGRRHRPRRLRCAHRVASNSASFTAAARACW